MDSRKGDRMQKLEYQKIPSMKDGKKFYWVTVVDDRPVSCSCPDWVFHIKENEPYLCKHCLLVVVNQT